jgi:hypothetical protein
MAKFADSVASKFFGKGDDDESSPDTDDTSDTTDEPTPGSLGKTLLAAIKKGDPEAVEEAVRAICG